VLGDAVGDERLVVLVVAGAQAEPALPAGVAEVGVAAHRVLGHALRRAHRRADAHAQRPPGAVGVAQPRLRLALEPLALDGREQAGLLRAPEVREVGGHQQVGRGVVALGAQALEQLGGGAAAQLDGQPGALLEAAERPLVAVLGAAVVDDDVRGAAERGHRAAEQEGEHEQHGEGEAPGMAQQQGGHRELG
jgi:hypothetical protein